MEAIPSVCYGRLRPGGFRGVQMSLNEVADSRPGCRHTPVALPFVCSPSQGIQSCCRVLLDLSLQSPVCIFFSFSFLYGFSF